MSEVQSYKNHVRWYPPFHFILAPVLLINLIYAAVRLYQEPGWDRGEYLLLAVGVFLLAFIARLFALKNQDRIIRLEERLRYNEILPADLAAKAREFRMSEIIALRFADDEELEALVRRVSEGEFEKQKEIKQAVTRWRADHMRV